MSADSDDAVSGGPVGAFGSFDSGMTPPSLHGVNWQQLSGGMQQPGDPSLLMLHGGGEPGGSGIGSGGDIGGVPMIVLMGTPSAGKTSILQVLFNKISPHETLENEASTHIQYSEIHYSDFVHFEICDVPGHIDVTASAELGGQIFGRCSMLIYV